MYLDTRYPQLDMSSLELVSREDRKRNIKEIIADLFGIFAEPENKGCGKIIGTEKSGPIHLHSTNIEIFADLGLIPDWMRPSKLDFDKEYIDEEYYDLLMAARP